MTEKQFRETFDSLANSIKDLNEGGAKANLFIALLTLRLADADGSIHNLYQRVAKIYGEAIEKVQSAS